MPRVTSVSRPVNQLIYRGSAFRHCPPSLRCIRMSNNMTTFARSNSGPSEPAPSYLDSLPYFERLLHKASTTLTKSPTGLKISTALLANMPAAMIRTFVYPIYCGGETPDEVLRSIAKLRERGFSNVILSYSAEFCGPTAKSEDLGSLNVVDQINASVEDILLKVRSDRPGYIALKPSGLTPGAIKVLAAYDTVDPALREEYLNACRSLCQHAQDIGKGKVIMIFDAESSQLQDGVYKTQRQMMKEFNKDGKSVVGGTVQMYLQNSLDVLDRERDLAEKGNYGLCLKLVRGAYMSSEPKGIVHNTKKETDQSFNEGVRKCLMEPSSLTNLIIGSHNAHSVKLASNYLNSNDCFLKSDDVAFGQLMGMAEDEGDLLIKEGRNVVKYMPWGPVEQTRDYLLRRMEENGATMIAQPE